MGIFEAELWVKSLSDEQLKDELADGKSTATPITIEYFTITRYDVLKAEWERRLRGK